MKWTISPMGGEWRNKQYLGEWLTEPLFWWLTTQEQFPSNKTFDNHNCFIWGHFHTFTVSSLTSTDVTFICYKHQVITLKKLNSMDHGHCHASYWLEMEFGSIPSRARGTVEFSKEEMIDKEAWTAQSSGRCILARRTSRSHLIIVLPLRESKRIFPDRQIVDRAILQITSSSECPVNPDCWSTRPFSGHCM